MNNLIHCSNLVNIAFTKCNIKLKNIFIRALSSISIDAYNNTLKIYWEFTLKKPLI